MSYTFSVTNDAEGSVKEMVVVREKGFEIEMK
jgi:hypothetical protein